MTLPFDADRPKAMLPMADQASFAPSPPAVAWDAFVAHWARLPSMGWAICESTQRLGAVIGPASSPTVVPLPSGDASGWDAEAAQGWASLPEASLPRPLLKALVTHYTQRLATSPPNDEIEPLHDAYERYQRALTSGPPKPPRRPRRR